MLQDHHAWFRLAQRKAYELFSISLDPAVSTTRRQLFLRGFLDGLLLRNTEFAKIFYECPDILVGVTKCGICTDGLAILAKKISVDIDSIPGSAVYDTASQLGGLLSVEMEKGEIRVSAGKDTPLGKLGALSWSSVQHVSSSVERDRHFPINFLNRSRAIRHLVGAITSEQRSVVDRLCEWRKASYQTTDILRAVRMLRGAGLDPSKTRTLIEHLPTLDDDIESDTLSPQARLTLAHVRIKDGRTNEREIELQLRGIIHYDVLDTVVSGVIVFHDAFTNISDFGKRRACENIYLFETKWQWFMDHAEGLLGIEYLVRHGRMTSLANDPKFERFFRRFAQRMQYDILPRLGKIMHHTINMNGNIAQEYDKRRIVTFFKKLSALRSYGE